MSYIHYHQATDASFFLKKKSELIHPLEKMVKVLSLRREYQAVTPNPIKLLPCSPRFISLGAEMGEIRLYNWFQSFLVRLRGFLLSTLAVANPRHLILPMTYTE